MCARPRKVTDDEVFMAAHRAMSRVGPSELTLAHIAAEAGVTAGAARAALRLEARSDAEAVGAILRRAPARCSRELRQGHRSPLAVLRAYADCMAGMADTPAAFVRNLAYLQIDLTDPDFRKHFDEERARHARGAAEADSRSDRRRRAGVRRRTPNNSRARSKRSSAARC